MKTIPAGLQAQYDSGSIQAAEAIYFKLKDGTQHGFTTHDLPRSLDLSAWGGGASVLLDAAQGLFASAIATSSGLNVDNLELTTLDDGSFFDRTKLMQGQWNDAEFWIFRYPYTTATSSADVEVLLRGTVGGLVLRETTITLELRGLTQRLQQPVGIASSKTCRARLGSTKGMSKCLLDLAPHTHTHTVTAATDSVTFTASGASVHAVDYFGEGEVSWTSGANTGVTQKIRSFGAGGTFTFVLPMLGAIAPGDTFTAVAGCRKRLLPDCRDKFDNAINFQGEPHRPMTDDLIKPVPPNA